MEYFWEAFSLVIIAYVMNLLVHALVLAFKDQARLTGIQDPMGNVISHSVFFLLVVVVLNELLEWLY